MFFRPTYIIDGDVTDIELNRLYADNIRGLIFDLDSTLLAPHSGKLTDEVLQWLQAARKKFNLAVVTNNRRKEYIENAEAILHMPVLGDAWKPRRKAFNEALKLFNLSPDQVAVIGDRPLTDILGGKRAGMKTVLVYPLKSMNEPKWIRFFRKLEHIVIKY